MTIEQRKDEIEVADLRRQLALAGYDGMLFKGMNKARSLIKGKISFDTLPSNIRVHCTDAAEIVKATSSVTLDARVSIIILLQGTLRFTIGQRRHQVSADQGPTAFINCFSEGELFTRHLDNNQYVRKVNVSLPLSHLLARTQDAAEREKLVALFSHQSQFFPLKHDNEWCELANGLLAIQQQNDFETCILREQIALQILARGVAFLQSQPCATVIESEAHRAVKADPLAERIRLLIESSDSPLTLYDIATRLNASTSKVQRHFKKQYGTTFSDYQKLKRLEKARRAIVVDRLSIGEAAWIAGYQHVGNFITAFKKTFNISPAKLRRHHDTLG